MGKFKAGEFEIKKEEVQESPEIRVFKIDGGAEPTVGSFQFRKLKRDGEGDYQAVKKKFGALAATDPDRSARSRKDARFALNPLLRDPLTVEQEERRVIEEKVHQRIGAIAEEAKAAAATQGYDEGLKKGYEEAFKKFREEGVGRLKAFDAFLNEAEAAKQEILRANERFLVELIFRIAKMVMLKELSADKEYILRLARDLIERVGVRENIRVRIHPDDLATAGMLKESLEKALGNLTNFNVEGSNQVQRGGCMVETEWNAIDASVETQLQGIYQALTGGKQSGG